MPAELAANDARIKATVGGKYRRLLKKIEVRSDVTTYGDFRDFGHWDGTAYSGHSDLPTGYWVWAAQKSGSPEYLSYSGFVPVWTR